MLRLSAGVALKSHDDSSSQRGFRLDVCLDEEGPLVLPSEDPRVGQASVLSGIEVAFDLTQISGPSSYRTHYSRFG